jgi:hypothetical protein
MATHPINKKKPLRPSSNKLKLSVKTGQADGVASLETATPGR